MPDLLLMRFDTVAVFDHSFNHLLLITHLDLTEGSDIDAAWAKAEVELDALQARLEAPHLIRVVAPKPCAKHRKTAHYVTNWCTA